MKEKQTIAGPFLKWVGGKGQLLKQLEALLPKELYEEEFTYIEPFVGGGAMLFFMLQHFPNIRNVVINDINRNLTEAYRVVKEQPDELVLNLKRIEQEYKRLSDEESRKDYFLGMRQTFNEEALDALSKTSLLFFLNRTCFNGLYRENSRGKFNVPFGSYSNPTICNPEVIYADSQLLNKSDVEILNGDFEAIAQHIDRRRLCFIYFDPPYRPLSSTSSFNSYVKEAFNDDEQRRLAEFCRRLSNQGNCLWMLSNADCSAKNPEDRFFEEIYKDFDFQHVWASRSVNAVASKRGKLTELLIRNYQERENVWQVAEGEFNFNSYL